MNERVFAIEMGRLLTQFERTLSHDRARALTQIYFEALSDYPDAEFARACRMLRNTSKWMPQVAEIIEVIEAIRAEARAERRALETEQRRRAITEGGGGVLTQEEALENVRKVRDLVSQILGEDRTTKRPPLTRGVEALHEEVTRLHAMGAREMTDKKRDELERFKAHLERMPES